MTSRVNPRPGGRSARVQAAVHQATAELLALHPRSGLTVPLIAARAGVTPSTIYRRWGDVADLLADVALQRMRPEAPPADTGSVAGDLRAWVDQYVEEMSSEVGLTLLRDVLAAQNDASDGVPMSCRCAEFTSTQIGVLVDRGVARGEAVPEVDAVMDSVVSPIIYRSLFGPKPPTLEQARALLAACLAGAVRRPAGATG